jgi:ankyrin repeat protein
MDTTENKKDLFKAIQSGDHARVEEILAQELQLVDAVDENGLSAVLTAVYYNRPAIAARLVERGAHLNIFESAVTGDIARLRQFVEDEPGLVNATQEQDITPLHEAAQNGHLALVTLLLEYGADRLAKTTGGLTAADLARQPGHDEVVNLLEGSLPGSIPE